MAEAAKDVKQSAAMTQAEMEEAFNLFDRLGSGKLKTTTLDTLVRACGLTPSDAQIGGMKKEVDTEDTGEFDFPQLLALVQEHKEDAVKTPDEVLEAFRVFDKDGKGVISVEDLKSHMSNLGERLQENEVVDLIKDADPNGTGLVNYEEFVKKMSVGLVY